MNLKNLKQARKNMGLTQKDVADKLGIHYTTYRNYEQGQREPNNKTILALSNLFNVSTDYLLGKEDPLEALNLSSVGKAIVQLYISLPPQERTALAEHVVEIASKTNTQTIAKSMQKEDDADEYIMYTTTIGAEMDRRKALEAVQQAGKLDDTEAKKNAVW